MKVLTSRLCGIFPVLFICENNRYAMGTALALSESNTNISQKARSYGIESTQVDGMNVVDVKPQPVKRLITSASRKNRILSSVRPTDSAATLVSIRNCIGIKVKSPCGKKKAQ
ncbi:thiamine pyrophosphate-dependent enzyme [Vibrio sp. M60_M31a]